MPDEIQIPALRVKQWLPEWEGVPFDPAEHRRRPDPFFFQFALSATLLKRLTGVHKRAAEPGVARSEELSTQRLHQPARSNEIAEFVRYGFPWSELTPRQRTEEHPDLLKPGWLPSTILINILQPGDRRDDRGVAPSDLVRIEQHDDQLRDSPSAAGDADVGARRRRATSIRSDRWAASPLGL